MKNKTLQRVLSFCLALLLCFTWNIAEPLVVNAFAIELSWVTYALISFMAACGFTFAVSGGIEALQAEVEEKVDTYYQVRGIDLYQLIAQTLRFNNNNNGEPSFWFTMAALTAIGEFMEWLKSDEVWTGGVYENKTIGTYTYMYNDVPNLGELVQVKDGKYVSGTIFEPHEVENSYDNVFYPYKIPQTNGGYYFWSQKPNKGTIYHTKDTGLDTEKQYSTALGLYYPDGLTLSDFVGIGVGVVTSGVNAGCLIFGLLFNDGTFVLRNILYDVEGVTNNISYSIEMPETITEFDVDENKVVEISFDAFPDDVTYETPEEFAEAVKQQIIDTGTVPSIKTEVKTDPEAEPEPTPVLPPEQSDPDYPDIGELGLPSLGDALKAKFPFSLPWTLGSILGIFLAPRQTPKWEVNLPAPLNTSFMIDLSDYEQVGYISRWMSDISYAIALLLATRKFIHW